MYSTLELLLKTKNVMIHCGRELRLNVEWPVFTQSEEFASLENGQPDGKM